MHENDGSQEVYNHFENSKMVDLGDRYFGILIGGVDSWSDPDVKGLLLR